MTHQPRGSWLFTLRVLAALALLLPPLRLRLWLTRDERIAFTLVRQCARSVLRWAGCRVVVEHADLVPANRPVMFVSNHVSLADAAVLLAVLPFDIRFVANHVFARYAFLGAAIRAASAHIVDRDSWRSRAECGQTMEAALASGQSLLVFPEGGTSDDGRLRPFRNGAFRAAARTSHVLVPMAISGTREMFPSKAWWLSNVPVTVRILPPLIAGGTGREAVAALKADAVRSLRQHLEVEGVP